MCRLLARFWLYGRWFCDYGGGTRSRCWDLEMGAMVDTLLYALVVEDSPTIRQLIVFVLSRVKGLKVVEANDGADALKKLSQQHFDVLMTGINMPVMDGPVLISMVREDAANKAIKIIAITAEATHEDGPRALALGADAYITKPIQAPQVTSKVKEILKIS